MLVLERRTDPGKVLKVLKVLKVFKVLKARTMSTFPVPAVDRWRGHPHGVLTGCFGQRG